MRIEANPDRISQSVEAVAQHAGRLPTVIEHRIATRGTHGLTYLVNEQPAFSYRAELRSLPNGLQGRGTARNPIGEIYQYRIVGPPGYSLTDLRTLQERVLERRLEAVPGVIVVSHSPGPRVAGRSDNDAILQSLVVMRGGTKSTFTIHGVEAELANINSTGVLPPGVSLQEIHGRDSLISTASLNVSHRAGAGLLVAFLIH
jgi:Cu/Ag efflux pump CusA